MVNKIIERLQQWNKKMGVSGQSREEEEEDDDAASDSGNSNVNVVQVKSAMIQHSFVASRYVATVQEGAVESYSVASRERSDTDLLQDFQDGDDLVIRIVLEWLVEMLRPTEVCRFMTALKSAELIDKTRKLSFVSQDMVDSASDISEMPGTRFYLAIVTNRLSGVEESAIFLLQSPFSSDKELGIVKMLPIWSDLKIELLGAGTFRLTTVGESFLVGTWSIHSMWSAIATLQRARDLAKENNIFPRGKSHEWLGSYREVHQPTHDEFPPMVADAPVEAKGKVSAVTAAIMKRSSLKRDSNPDSADVRTVGSNVARAWTEKFPQSNSKSAGTGLKSKRNDKHHAHPMRRSTSSSATSETSGTVAHSAVGVGHDPCHSPANSQIQEVSKTGHTDNQCDPTPSSPQVSLTAEGNRTELTDSDDDSAASSRPRRFRGSFQRRVSMPKVSRLGGKKGLPHKQDLVKALRHIVSTYPDPDALTTSYVLDELHNLFGPDLIAEGGYSKAFIDEQILKVYGQLEPPSLILENLYLGSEYNASNKEELVKLGIEYVLNVTFEIENFFPSLFEYLKVPIRDLPSSNIGQHFGQTCEFIHHALSEGSGVLVHCQRGISRSGSVVIAYVMKHRNLSFEDATAYVRKHRSAVRPNRGFVKQLLEFEEKNVVLA